MKNLIVVISELVLLLISAHFALMSASQKGGLFFGDINRK